VTGPLQDREARAAADLNLRLQRPLRWPLLQGSDNAAL